MARRDYRRTRAFSSEVPVRVRKTRQIKNLEPRFGSIETENALASPILPSYLTEMSPPAPKMAPVGAAGGLVFATIAGLGSRQCLFRKKSEILGAEVSVVHEFPSSGRSGLPVRAALDCCHCSDRALRLRRRSRAGRERAAARDRHQIRRAGFFALAGDDRAGESNRTHVPQGVA